VFAVDDDLVEGLDNVQLTFSVASVANGYSDLIGPSVSVPIVGNDVAGLTVANSSIQFQWFDCLSQVTGVTQACLFSSSSQHGVVVVQVSDTVRLRASHSRITILPSAWNGWTSVTVTAVDDGIAQQISTPVSVAITVVAEAGGDAVFAAATAPVVIRSVLIDND
jgi:hypothetical protein